VCVCVCVCVSDSVCVQAQDLFALCIESTAQERKISSQKYTHEKPRLKRSERQELVCVCVCESSPSLNQGH